MDFLLEIWNICLASEKKLIIHWFNVFLPKKMLAFSCSPQNVSMEGRQRQINNLLKTFMDFVDSFFPACPHSKSDTIQDDINLILDIFFLRGK